MAVTSKILLWQGKKECASFAEFGFHTDSASVHLNDLFDNRKADAGAIALILRRKRLE